MKYNLTFFISNFSFGGAGNSIVRLVENLPPEYYKINVISLNKCDYKSRLNRRGIFVKVINKNKLTFSIFQLIQTINQTYVKNKKNILVSNIHYNNVIIILLKFFFKPFKLVIVERTPIEELDIFFTLKDFLKKKIIKFLIKKTYNYSDIIVANSKGIAKGVKQILNKKIYVIYPPSIKKINKPKKNKNKKVTFFCFTRLSEEKNLLCLLKAIKLLDSDKYFFSIYGDGPEKNNLKEFCIKHDLIKNVKFKGFAKSISNIREKVYISTSLFEGCGNSTIEALNNSKILICSDCPGGNREILNNKRYGIFFKNNDHKDLAEKIKFTYENINFFSKGKRQFSNNLRKFLEEENFKKYKKLFKLI